MTGAVFWTLLFSRILQVLSQNFDLLAYDYIRRFQKPLEMGHCASRHLKMEKGDETIKSCMLKKEGKASSKLRVTNSSFVLTLTDKNLFTHLSLCDGNAASYLGLLYSGECVAVEIAKKLDFGDKTYTRAFVEYYQTGLSRLENSWPIFEGYLHYYKDDYYLKDLSHGMFELIIVQMTFDSKKARKDAQKLKLVPPLLSEQLEVIGETVKNPIETKIIRLSTSEKVRNFTTFGADQFPVAIKLVQWFEVDVRRMRTLVAQDEGRCCQLKYGLLPFAMAKSESENDLLSRELWENITRMEIDFSRVVSFKKKGIKKCGKKKTPDICKRIQKRIRNIKKFASRIHSVRTRWYYLTREEKLAEVEKYDLKSRAVESSLAKLVERRRCRRKRMREKKSRLLERHNRIAAEI